MEPLRPPSSQRSRRSHRVRAAALRPPLRRLKAALAVVPLKAVAAVSKDAESPNYAREGGKLRFPSFLLYQLRSQSSWLRPSFRFPPLREGNRAAHIAVPPARRGNLKEGVIDLPHHT